MRQLSKAKTKDDVDFIFEQLKVISDDERINGNVFYFFILFLFITN